MTDVVTAAPAPAAPASAPVAAPTPAPQAEAPITQPLAIGEPEAKATPEVPGSVAAPEAGVVIQYEKTGDPGLDMALEFVGARGFDASHPAMKAAENGDFSLIKAALSAMGDGAKGFENFVALAEQSHKATAAKNAERAAKDADMIHKAVGGKEAWAAVSKWAGTNAEPEEKAAVNAALKQGGLTAKVMAQWLAAQYNKASGTVVEPKSVTSPDAAGKSDPVGPLSAKEYADAVAAGAAKVPNFENSPQYRQLQARRLAGRRAGK